jgi:hypothetical protein
MKLAAKIIIIIALFAFGYYFGLSQGKCLDQDACSVNNNQNSQAVSETTKVKLMVDFGDGQINTFNDVEVSKEASVFDLLSQVAEKNNLKLEYKDYGGSMGVFVDSINGIGSGLGGNKYWQFWVNNVFSEVGASSYRLQSGDMVEWKYIKEQLNK